MVKCQRYCTVGTPTFEFKLFSSHNYIPEEMLSILETNTREQSLFRVCDVLWQKEASVGAQSPQSPNCPSHLITASSPPAWRHLTIFLAHTTSPEGDRCFTLRLGSYGTQIDELLKCSQRFPADVLLMSDLPPGFRLEEMIANTGGGCWISLPWI